MKPGTEIRQVTPRRDSLAPDLFVVPPHMALTGGIEELRRDSRQVKLLQHPIGVHQLTSVLIDVARDEAITRETKMLTDAGVVQIVRASTSVAVLTFDDSQRGTTRDFRPDLPLVIQY